MVRDRLGNPNGHEKFRFGRRIPPTLESWKIMDNGSPANAVPKSV